MLLLAGFISLLVCTHRRWRHSQAVVPWSHSCRHNKSSMSMSSTTTSTRADIVTIIIMGGQGEGEEGIKAVTHTMVQEFVQ